MTKTAKDYPVTDGFGVTYKPWSPASPHLGEDRSCPCGTPVEVGSILIGLTGTTGKSSGCHLHIQKVSRGRVVSPNGGGFDIPLPAVVYEIGENKTIGKYVRIRDAQGQEWSYFHLSEIKVKQGDQIGGDMPLTPSQKDKAWKMAKESDPTADELNNPAYNDARVLIDTAWNSYGKKRLENKVTKQDVDNLLKDVGITPVKSDYDALLMLPNDFAYWLQGRIKKAVSSENYIPVEEPLFKKKG